MSKHKQHSKNDFTFISFIWRLLLATALVFATFNPSGYSAYHWIVGAIKVSEFGPLHAVALIILIIGWVVVWVATWRSLETLGVILASLAMAAIIWLLIDIGLLKPQSVSGYTWVILAGLSLILAIGMSWSHLWRRLTGQYSIEDLDE